MSYRILPPRRNINKERIQAYRRRVALAKDGCATYRITSDRDGSELAIQCLCCGLTSHNPNDVANRYCGFCHEWHSDWIDGEATP